MIQETEDDRLDQSLRDTFSDFDLPPSSHVWTGIESHLSAQPAPTRPLPLLLVLPIVGLVGVTVGWLLPRPATISPVPRPANEATTKTRLASLSTQLHKNAGTAYTIPRSSTIALAFPHTSKQVTALIDKPIAKRIATTFSPKAKSHNSSPPPEFVASANTLTPIDSLPLRAVSSIESVAALAESAVQPELPIISQVGPSVNQALDTSVAAAPSVRSSTAEALEPSQRVEGLRERRPEYRVPTHRLAERGRGLRRIQNNFVKHWQHFFGPHRARVAAQPDF
ncbi:hypothetical protein [Hymenobacter volaticus]|uniref:Uncharacterized protein n=1 Tax=Hymenobacter volaticus TaxID=2932254 RepID=A0ABY4G520_9BACT|nr:hypothetical protein [Hymenobacter volaticus]UOQ65872.1 hypothetical protein MUN86_20495 [Hymenobacter volaticus]